MYIKKIIKKNYIKKINKSSKSLDNELKSLSNESVCNAVVEVPDQNNPYKWLIHLPGLQGSPFEGGVFKLSFEFPAN